ncbi:GA-binding protein subunit beta-1 isoform X2 [Thrips palmi]|uniref:GA-binding protein subunit beta-1 isoform X2 n=1 Tax=Thrips palmi TaxID=161013 RepID=A0A6P8Z9R4_THRPL|nr:GA-binding protein subunit beta-1 isoform X2 [Thrips palmi]
MQGIMNVDDVELDPSLFQIPSSDGAMQVVGTTRVVELRASRPGLTVAVVELGKQLLVAAKDGQVDVVRDLMSKGAPFTTDWLGVSPLHLAVQNNHVDTAEVLLRAGISQEARTKVDRTPLHMAAQGGHLESVKLLLRHGADINCTDMLKMTPLHWAVENQNVEVIKTLLQAGADAFTLSKFDKTPVTMARDLGRHDIADLIENADFGPQLVRQSVELDQESLAATESIAAELTTDHHQVTQEIQAAVTAFSLETESSPLSTLTSPVSEASQDNNSTFQLLQAHGITMLPTDESTTVESAMESGQRVVLTEAGKMALNLTKVGSRLITLPKGKTLTSGGIVKRNTVLGNKSRILKIHPSQLVALGRGRVQVPSQLVMQQNKGPNILKRMAITNNSPVTTIKTIPVSAANGVQRVMISPQQNQQIQQLIQQNQKEGAQQIQLHQIQTHMPSNLSQLGEPMIVSTEEDYEEEENEEPPIPTDLETIAQELANARKEAAEFRKQLAKKEREAELYLQQLRSIKSGAE